MNTNRIPRTDPLDEGARFDRLVDGELSPEEYRRMLAALEDEPGAWRRCTLAFLEAQALQRELGALRRQVEQPTPAPKAMAPRRLVPAWQALLAIAASVVLAFGLGLASAGFLAFPPQEPLAGGNHRPQPEVVAEATGQGAGEPPNRHVVLRPAGSVRLVVSDAAGEPTDMGELPVFEVNQNVEQYFADRKPAIPAELINLLELRGHTVEHHEQYLPIDLEDGRQMIVPVEEYRITPTAVVF
jgi:hypothetical protein